MLDSDLLARCEDSPGWAADEIERLREQLGDYRNCERAAMDAPCDEKHCGCVPLLLHEIERLRKEMWLLYEKNLHLNNKITDLEEEIERSR